MMKPSFNTNKNVWFVLIKKEMQEASAKNDAACQCYDYASISETGYIAGGDAPQWARNLPRVREPQPPPELLSWDEAFAAIFVGAEAVVAARTKRQLLARARSC